MMTAQQARQVASFIKYPPHGGRGVAFGIAHDDYQPGPADEKIAAANDKTAFVALMLQLMPVGDLLEHLAVGQLENALVKFDIGLGIFIDMGQRVIAVIET